MARTTGPILAIGAITLGNNSLIHDQPIDIRIPVGTAVAAGLFAIAERGWERGAVALAWMALATVLLTRTDPRIPSPAESVLTWWQKK